jgi:hypothetical protein
VQEIRKWIVRVFTETAAENDKNPLPDRTDKWVFYCLKGWAAMSVKVTQKSIINDSIIKDLSEQVTNLKYGTIVIKVHDAKIVQVEVTERTRYEDVWLVEKGGGI